MTFGSSFGRTFSPTFHPKSQAKAGGNWWLAGGVNPTNCVAAYQPKRAASYDASLTNLANPGTYTCYRTYGTEGFDEDYGWLIAAYKQRIATQAPITDPSSRTIIVYGKKKGYGRVFDNNPSNNIRHNYNQYSYVNNGSTTALTTTMALDTEYIVALSANGFYLNGSFVNATTLGSTPADSVTVIGNNLTGGLASEYYISACAIYNNNLTSAQIEAITAALYAL